MSEDYSFEDKMKSLFEDEREHPYEPDQWRRLARRLKDHDRPPTVWWQRWMPYGFALLVGLLGWQLWQQRKLQQTVLGLTEQLATVENRDQRPTPKTSQSVVVYDTVYRQTIIETTTERHSAEGPERMLTGGFGRNATTIEFDSPLFFPGPESGGGQRFGLGAADFTTMAHQGFQEYRATAGRALVEGASPPSSQPHYITEQLTANAVQQLRLKGFAFPTLPAPAAAPYKLPAPPLWQRIKPKGYDVSVGGGLFKSWAYYGSDDGDVFGDLNVELFIKDRLSLEIGAAYLQRAFERNEPENAPNDLPVVPPLNSNDELESITGNLKQLQFPIGLRYYAWEAGRVQFHIGAGLMPVMDLSSSSIQVEYEDEDDEYYTLSAPEVFSSGLRLGGAYGRLGIKAGLGKRWHLGVSATALQTFGTYTYAYQRPSWGRWRVGVGLAL